MLIDWFTVGAQVLNFLVLVWLMKRFLYKPILHALDEREKRIAAELAEAEAKAADAQKEREEFQRKNAAFDRERAALFDKVTDAARAERERLLDQARQEAEMLRAKLQETLRSDNRNLRAGLSRTTCEEVFAIARKTLSDLASADLEAQMAGVFIRRLREVSGVERQDLQAAISRAAGPVRVRSAFLLPAAEQSAIAGVVKEVFDVSLQLEFEVRPELVSGIELSVDGNKVAWSIVDYLASLERSVDLLLEAQTKPEPGTRPPSNLQTSTREAASV